MKDQGDDHFKQIIPRMGGFHIMICMLRTIYSLFSKVGFTQVLSAAGLGGLGTVKKSLKGGNVNEGINLHKKLFEAIMRSKIDYLNSSDDSCIVTICSTSLNSR